MADVVNSFQPSKASTKGVECSLRQEDGLNHHKQKNGIDQEPIDDWFFPERQVVNVCMKYINLAPYGLTIEAGLTNLHRKHTEQTPVEQIP